MRDLSLHLLDLAQNSITAGASLVTIRLTLAEDGMLTLHAARCRCACGLAPVRMIGEEVFGRLTPALVPGILDKFRA